jgi:hypothetical protein
MCVCVCVVCIPIPLVLAFVLFNATDRLPLYRRGKDNTENTALILLRGADHTENSAFYYCVARTT